MTLHVLCFLHWSPFHKIPLFIGNKKSNTHNRFVDLNKYRLCHYVQIIISECYCLIVNIVCMLVFIYTNKLSLYVDLSVCLMNKFS